ncbi:MAG: hypothetical protein Q9168_008277 [Polycauliona sp. 1 TL-2023]
MNDDLQAAEDGLANASERLADAESTSSADHRKAQRDPHVHKSAIYPVGSEFALCNAQAQLMSAVVGVLNESLTESIRGFYKLRKAFVTLDAILAAEDKYMRGHPRQATSVRASIDSARSNRSSRSTNAITAGLGNDRSGGKKQEKSLLDTVRQNEAQAVAKSTKDSNGAPKAEDDDDDDDEFYDADEAHDSSQTDTYAGHIEINGVSRDSAKSSLDVERDGEDRDLPPLKTLSSGHQVLDHDPDSEIFSNPIDVFIHSGANLSFGLLLVMISMIPPAFNKLLFIIGFHGDRDRGLRLLWQASKFHNINGAMAGLCLLGFYHQVISYADILPEVSLTRAADNSTQQDVQGYPQERCEALLQDMRARHPKSQLWLLEQARMESMKRRLSSSLSILGDASATKSPLKQVEALNMFEKSLTAMFAHEYALCAESFLKCVQLNNWSHTLYYYIAGAAHVEMHRHLVMSGHSNTKECKKHAEKATEYLHQAPQHAGKKKFMARQLPFDVFVARKVQKWDARAKEWDVPFIEAVGVSPLEEIIFFFNGYGRMDDAQLGTSLQNLKWSDESEGNRKMWANEEKDEKAILAILRAVTLRNLRRWDDAVDVLKEGVMGVPNAELKGGLRDDWTAPCARYEMGVVCWMRRRDGGGSGGSGGKDGDGGKGEEEWVRECESWLTKAAEWGSFELDARIGLKIATAQDTLKKFWDAREGRKV